MFFILSKLLKGLLFPTTWIFGLLGAACFVRNRKWRVGLSIAASAITLLFTNKQLLLTAQYAYTRNYAQQSIPTDHYPVALIMGGFGIGVDSLTGQPAFLHDRGARLWEGIRLWQCGVVDKLLISGDATCNVDAHGNGTADYFLCYMRSFGLPDSCILLEQHARNTRENATRSIALLDSLGYGANDCLLITSASHMNRSVDCFAHAGWNVDCYASNIYPHPTYQLSNFAPSWHVMTDWHELINEWGGNVAYRIVGYR
ncbi:MAG: YdcF family protein [Bacteroidales bacterium]|nr:YdcF family protein [Bacteroidales bacterium]